MKESHSKAKRIVLYDDNCNLCNWSVDFMKNHDPEGLFSPVAFQSEEGKAFADKLGIESAVPHSVVLLEAGSNYQRSRAGLRIMKQLKGMGFLASVLALLPERTLDHVYDFIARHRLRLFGRKRRGDQSMRSSGHSA